MPRKKKPVEPVLTPLQKELGKRGIQLLDVKTVNVSHESFFKRTQYRNLHVVKVAAYGYQPVHLSVLAYEPPDNVEDAVGQAFEASMLWVNREALDALFKTRYKTVAQYMAWILDNRNTPPLDDDESTAYEEIDTAVPW